MLPPDEEEIAQLRAAQAAILGTSGLIGLIAGGGLLLAGDGDAAAIMSAFGAGCALVAAWAHRRYRRHRDADRTWFEQRFPR